MTILLGVMLAAALAQTPGSPGAILSGRVLEDASRSPVVGARVTLIPTRVEAPQPPFIDRSVVTVTDREGRYRFEDLDAGRYRVMVQKAGFAPLDGPRTLEIALEAGRLRPDLNLTLQKGAVITGRVLDESGEPLAEANVVAMTRPPAPLNAPTRPDFLVPAGARVLTNDLGEFRLFSLPPGEYFIQAMPANFGGSQPSGPMTLLPTYFPNSSDPQSALSISVTQGQTARDIVLQMIAVRAFTVSGVVRNGEGQPVAGAMVRVTTNDSPRAMAMRMGPGLQSRSDSSGRFTLRNVTSGSYTLLAVAPVVVSRRATGPGGGARGGTVFAGGGSVGGVVAGSGTGIVMTETSSDGTTVEYRDDRGVRVPIEVGNTDVIGLDVTLP